MEETIFIWYFFWGGGVSVDILGISQICYLESFIRSMVGACFVLGRDILHWSQLTYWKSARFDIWKASFSMSIWGFFFFNDFVSLLVSGFSDIFFVSS